ncbi:hypothetical protein Ga0080574_TMP1548 [Salipiger abyssi]|uniref:Uncharacterized protein n=1 Tax=Salipiger abyssi TaxID=1250539 RepID=A0A1P8UR59_9RHOB|nr:hypothetical protein Ga0080574_TMP1548 [Salipiger abyssi]
MGLFPVFLTYVLHGASRAGSSFKAPCASAGHQRRALPG